jgi:pimeloyl-ACP methyl ester carboxylesterase
VLYVHWLENGAPNSNRTQFIEEAVGLAREGVVSLLVETNWEEPNWYSRRSPATDYADSVRQVINLRRGLDLLEQHPNVDPNRIAYVGHDFGGMYGATLSAVDHRARAMVIIAATPRYPEWFLFGATLSTSQRRDFAEEMSPIDPITLIPFAAPASLLFQFGTDDFYVPMDRAEEFFGAASEPKQRLDYESGHDMEHEEIREDRLAFLREQLGIVAVGE